MGVERRKIVKELAPCAGYISTGCTLMDLAISNSLPGGFGIGRISHIYGDESTAKSVILAECLGSIQRQGGKAILVDVENTFDLVRANTLFGVNPETLDLKTCTSIEEFFNVVVAETIEQNKKDAEDGNIINTVIGVDSLTALPSEVEVKEKVGETGYGASRAKRLSESFRKYIHPLSHSNVSLLFIDQTRTNITKTFGDKKVVSGGQALKFYASTRVKLSEVQKIKNSFKLVIGVKLGFIVKKNKIAPPFRSGDFTLYFDYGIDNIRTNLEWMKEIQSLKEYDLNGKVYKQIDSAIKYVEENSLETWLDDQVHKVWDVVYEPLPRKEKQR